MGRIHTSQSLCGHDKDVVVLIIYIPTTLANAVMLHYGKIALANFTQLWLDMPSNNW